MSNILKDITNHVKVEESPSIFEQQINVNKKTNRLLNNLDELDDTIGQFNVKVLGIGGAGCNVITHMMSARVWPENIDLYALNTDCKALKKIEGLSNVYLLGKNTLRGAGSGGDPMVGKIAVEECKEDIKEALKGTDILFIIAGLGKGTGSGASPEIAKIAKELNILTVAIVNFPSVNAEGCNIYENALNSFAILKSNVDSITKISNDKIITNNKDISFVKAFEKANQELTNAIGEIIDMINSASNMNLDFADVKNFFKSHNTFMSGVFELNDDYAYEKLRTVMINNIQQNFSDVNIRHENIKVLMNFKINVHTPSSITNDVRHVLKEITQNNTLTLAHGIDYTNDNGIKVSYLISASNEHQSPTEMINEQKPTRINEVDNNILDDEIFHIKDDINLDEYRSPSGVKKETIKFNTEELVIEGNRFDTREASRLITKAINNVMHKTTLMDKPLKNN